MIVLKTNLGTIKLELDYDKAPATCANFERYVNEGHYDGTIFHRVIKGFMIQGGGLTPQMDPKPAHDPIENEADNGLSNDRGTIAMARTPDPHSATCQFFINTVDNDFLNFKSPDPSGFGYCVFGKVVEGMETVDAIEGVKTAKLHGMRDVPTQTVVIEQAVKE